MGYPAAGEVAMGSLLRRRAALAAIALVSVWAILLLLFIELAEVAASF